MTVDLDAAAALAVRLMKRHGLTDWALVFDHAKTRAGICRHDRKQIGLSQPLTRLHTDDEVRDTILHEIAHALVGPDHGHDAVWRRTALDIGSSGTRCISSTSGSLPGAWTGKCRAGHEITRHRRPERVLSCPACSPRFNARAIYEWTHHGRPALMHPMYEAELALIHEVVTVESDAPHPGALIPPQSVRPLLPVGTPVVISDPGPLAGQTGRVFRRGRTRYEVLTSRGVISITATAVRPQ